MTGNAIPSAPGRGPLLLLRAAGLALVAAGVFWGWPAIQRQRAWADAVATSPAPGVVASAGLNERIAALAARVRDHDLSALGELARLFHANQKMAEAEQAYAALLVLEPKAARWPHLLAHLRAGRGELAAAAELWARASELAPDYRPARLRWGEVLLKTNRADEAAEVYAAALAQAPDDAYALLGLARCELRRERLTAARERLQQAVQAQPEFGAAWHLLATVYQRLGNASGENSARVRAESLKRFREMPDPWLQELLRDCYDVYQLRIAAAAARAAGDPGGATPWLERALQLAPEDAAVHRDFGDLWAEQGEFQKAQAAFARAAQLDPTHADGYLRWVAACTRAGDDAAAQQALAAGLARCPDAAGLHFEHGQRLAAAGQWDDALVAFREAQRLKPEAPEAAHEIAAICFRLGRNAEGLAALEGVFTHLPGHAGTLRALARRTIELGDAAAARHWLQELHTRRVPSSDDGYEELAHSFRERFGAGP